MLTTSRKPKKLFIWLFWFVMMLLLTVNWDGYMTYFATMLKLWDIFPTLIFYEISAYEILNVCKVVILLKMYYFFIWLVATLHVSKFHLMSNLTCLYSLFTNSCGNCGLEGSQVMTVAIRLRLEPLLLSFDYLFGKF